jgi:putative spermidine/putrescine transport system substrate-binding protein
MSEGTRRALLAGAVATPLAIPSVRAMAQDRRMQRIRVSIAVDRQDEFLPLLRNYSASEPGHTVEILVRDDNSGLIAPQGTEELRPGQRGADAWGADAALTDIHDLAWGTARGAWRSLPASLREGAAASAGRLSQLMQPLAGEEAMLVSADPGGPVLLHRPRILPDPPADAAALLDYARQNPGRFFYPRPSESAFGRLFLLALPHLLGDRDPADAQTGWTRTWAWLQELDRYVSYYPSNDEAAFEDLAAGDAHLFPVPLPPLLRRRMDGTLTEETKFGTLGPNIPQGVFLVVPRITADERLPLIEQFGRFLLRPEVQSRFFGRGILPGDLGFGLNEATPRTDAERSALGRILPPDEAERIVARPLAPRINSYQLTFLLRRWEELIGARHGERR